jgi:glutaredoxin-like protein NrdH
MDHITVQGKLAYVECNATLHRMDYAGVDQADPISPKILCLMRHTNSGEYLQAPVVVAGNQHWSGFRPDRIKALTNPAVFASDATAVRA